MEQPHPQDAVTIPEWLNALASAYGDAVCVSSDSSVRSYREVDVTSSARARGLLASGIGKGSRVGLLFGNGAEWVMWWAAITRIGALCVPVSTFLQPAELERVVRHADLTMLVAVRHFLKRDFEQVIDQALPSLASSAGPTLALPEVPYLRSIVLDDTTARWATSTEQLVAGGRNEAWNAVFVAAEREVHVDDEAICIYTSGQSADPKGVVHSQSTVVSKAHYFREMFQFTPETQTEVTMPFFWVGGLVMSLFPTMDAGGVTTCTERSTWGSSGLVGNVQSAADLWRRDFSDFRKFPALGMTETFGMYSWADELPLAEYPIAPPIDSLQPGFDLRLVDDNGEDVPEGIPGEIIVRGPTLALRLQKVRRSDVFTPDGYYRTGDRGIRLGARVCFLGRIGDMIKTSGANVSPAEVEREIQAIDGVTVAHVVALDDGTRNQLVGAAVVLAPESQLTTNGIRDILRSRLSSYKVPKVLVVLDSIDEVPMTPTMKVRKRQLAELIAERHEKDVAASDG